jgi:hypothetical protein
LNGGDLRNVDAQLTVGTTSQTIEVNGAADVVAPVDSGEKTDLITQKELQNFVAVGSNAAEFIKIMPVLASRTERPTRPTIPVKPSASTPMAAPAARAR